MSRIPRVCFTLALLALLALALQATGQAGSYQVVANDGVGADQISRSELSRIFLKKTSRWPDGTAAEPVDRDADAPTRTAFSREVHDKEVAWIQSYWQRLLFSGRETPPPELASDREVLEFVGRTPGAVGYVGSDASLGSGVKALRVTR